MRRQLSCSFCKELYREPILLQCDHNLCRTCLPKVQVGTSDIVRCPECHQDCNNTALRRNPLLENIVERYREAEGNQQLYCEEHGVRLELFCKEEQKAICLVCGTSQRHRDHQHEAIAVAADGYKRELENSLRALQEEENEARKCLEEEKQEIRKLKEKKNYLKKKVGEELGRLQDFLEDERKKINRELDATEERYIKILEENKRRISHQIPELQNAIAEITNTLERAEPELLRDIGTTLHRAEVQFINPERPSVDLCEEEFIGPFQYKVWKRMKDSIIPVLESLTIDPDTAHKQLIVSRDQSNIKYGLAQQDLPDGPKRFENSFAALSSKGFKSGKHYWEVEVEGKAFWVLGVAKHSVERKRPLTSPLQDGLWTLCLKNKSIYAASSTPAEPLSLEKTPTRIGVYLNYEGGKVSFYNADDLSHIYTYTNKFTEEMYPYFNLYCSDVDDEDDIPLKIFPL
nr:PREDICTED: zinc-binding protein A33-like isoform X3 [Latimeria chalumnae]|eukprot:XP_014353690.1 PREDICTED: zinc-binding protein A33-like isoform X3 [Latimeria chalumnae]